MSVRLTFYWSDDQMRRLIQVLDEGLVDLVDEIDQANDDEEDSECDCAGKCECNPDVQDVSVLYAHKIFLHNLKSLLESKVKTPAEAKLDTLLNGSYAAKLSDFHKKNLKAEILKHFTLKP